MPPLVGDADPGGGCEGVRARGMWEISVPSTQFCCEPKTALKKENNEVLKKKTLSQ